MDPPAVLLDTHALLWWTTGDQSLSRKVRKLLGDDATTVVVSAASAWEIATKVRLGKLGWSSPLSVEEYCRSQRFDLLAVTFAHAEKAGGWTQTHGDPFDRMLAAQSEIEHLPIVTNDARIKLFGCATYW